MLPSYTNSKFGKLAQRVEFKLVLFFAYVATLVYVWIKSGHFWPVIFIHIFFVLLVAIIYFGVELIMLIASPILLVVMPIERYFIKRYLAQFKQNKPAEVVVILGHPNWFKLEGWLKPIFMKGEIKYLVKYLEAKKQDFSFYPNANFAEVEKIMADKKIKEVYFFGHGNSHEFQLGTDEMLYYCDFGNPKYGKQFVHQVHCGDPYGKSLLDYVAPEKNRAKCFFFRKPINSRDIVKEFKRRTKELAR